MAGRLSDGWLEELRGRASIEEVVSDYVRLKQKGKRYWGLCPFHNEKTASFSVDSQNQLYYCFGCHKGGDVIDFVMSEEHMDFMEAVRLLADRYHMDLPERIQGPSDGVSREEKERILEANVQTARYFHELLWKSEGAQALNYLYKRGLNDADIRRFGLGASPRGRNDLQRHLEAQGFEAPLLEKAGLIVRGEHGAHDMFRERAMFPIINAQGKVIGFGGRAMGDQQPKYLNTQETPVFNKRQSLYAMNMAKNERAVGHLVLVEGYMDVVSLRKYGVKGVVATLGTALTEEQARLIKRYAPEVWISYDGDGAGRKAALRALDIFDSQDMYARVIDYPPGMDPDDFIRAKGLEGFNALPKLGGIEYRLLRAKDDLDLDTQEGMTQYALRGCEILQRVKSPIELENHLRRLANETGYDREILLRQIGATVNTVVPPATRGPSQRRRAPAETASEVQLAERALLSLLAAGLLPAGMLNADDFSSDVLKRLLTALESGRPVNAFIGELEDEEERGAAMRALNYEPLPEDRETALAMAEASLKTIRRARMEARIEQIKQEINSASPERRAELYEQMTAILSEMGS